MPQKKRKKKSGDTRTQSQRQRAFLDAFADLGSIVHAAGKAEINRFTHYEWLRSAKYAAAFEKARIRGCDVLESEAVRRAVTGYPEPIYYQGTAVGTVQRYDSGLLQFLLRGHNPMRYGFRTEISGPAGRPIEFKLAERLAAADKRLIEMRKNEDDRAAG